MTSLTQGPSHHHALMISTPMSFCRLARVLSQRQKMFARLGHGCFIAHLLCILSLFSQNRGAHEWSKAGTHVSGDGEEAIHHCVMVGRIFKIAVTKTRHEYVIMEAFDILESRDHPYGMPVMHASPNQGYQVVPPSVSCEHSLRYCHRLLPSTRVSHSFSTFNMIVKVGNVDTQLTKPVNKMVNRQQRPRGGLCTPLMTNILSTCTCFTMRGAFARPCLKTSQSPYPMSLTVRSSTVRWQKNYRRQTPKSTRGQRRRQRRCANERNKRLSRQGELKTCKVKMRQIRHCNTGTVISPDISRR